MTSVSVQEWELLGFFESEPTFGEPGIPWAYSDLVYRVQRGQSELEFLLHPSYRDVRITLRVSGDAVYEYRGSGLADVRLVTDETVASLEVIVAEGERITIHLTPYLRVTHARALDA